jgi:hypothetical protein
VWACARVSLRAVSRNVCVCRHAAFVEGGGLTRRERIKKIKKNDHHNYVCVRARSCKRRREIFEIPACPGVRYPVVCIRTYTYIYINKFIYIYIYINKFIYVDELFTFVGSGERKRGEKKFAIKYKVRPDERDRYHQRLSP